MSDELKEISETNNVMASIADAVDKLQFDGEALKGQEIDQTKVDWYTHRFDLFVSDGVYAAINAYLQKLQSEDMNELTRAVILHEALNRQLNK
jgi:hypothetical protein